MTSVHLLNSDHLYTGDMDGVLASWKIKQIMKKPSPRPEFFFNDHDSSIISIDANFDIDLYVSGSANSCIIRVISTNRYFKTISPNLFDVAEYSIFKVMISARGYIVIQERSTFSNYEHDKLIVYSINGEKIAERKLDEYINGLLFDQTQYFIVFPNY